MRQLSDEEKMFAQKVIDGQSAELKHLKLMVKYNEFMLDEMLESNYLEKRRGFVKQTKDFKNEITEIQRTVDITAEQIAKGVEIKEKTGQDANIVPSMVK